LEDRTLLATWTALGPAPLANGQTAGKLLVSGRVTGVAADPVDANTLFIAAAGGGVWKTTNGGTNWTPLTDNLTSGGSPLPQFMGAVAETRDTANNEIVYAGMSEANNSGDSFYGDGILVSRNGGATWTLTNAAGALTGQTVSKIVIDPSDASGGTAYAAVASLGVNGPAAVGSGIWKTTDFGAHWTNTTASLPNNPTYNSWSDVVIDPGTPNTLFAAEGNPFNDFGYATGNGVYESTNGGASWTVLRSAPTGTQDGRITLALFDANGTFELFVAIAVPSNLSNGDQLFKMLKSTNGGSTFTDLTASVPNYMGDQGSYDSTLAISPTNPNYIYAAGDMANQGPTFSGSPIESFDGGLTWHDIATDPAGMGPHTDAHAVAFDAAGNLLDGDDGGLFKLTKPTDLVNQRWSSLNGTSTPLSSTASPSIRPTPVLPTAAARTTARRSTRVRPVGPRSRAATAARLGWTPPTTTASTRSSMGRTSLARTTAAPTSQTSRGASRGNTSTTPTPPPTRWIPRAPSCTARII
jgi:hypothetical protein